MKFRFFFSYVLILMTQSSFSQSHFQKVYSLEFDVDEAGLSILESNSDLYVMSTGISYENPKKYFVTLDADGKILQNIVFSNLSGRGNCFHQYEENLLFTGADLKNGVQTTLLFDTSGYELERYICVSDSLPSDNIAATTLYGEYLVTSKNSFTNDESDIHTSLCWINLVTGLVDTMIIEDNGFNDQIGDIVVGPDSLLTVVYMYQDPENKSDYYRSIHKFNKEREKIWEWTSEKHTSNTRSHGFTLAILEDGRMVHTNGRFNYKDRESASIRAINPDGTLSWYYDFPVWLLPSPVEEFFKYRLFHLIRTRNNDLVGCGWFDNVPNLKGYVFRMSSEGEMLWERYYYKDSIDFIDEFGYEYISGGQFFDVEELENGDLAVVGEKQTRYQKEDGTWSQNKDLWLLRLNSEGCIGDYCGEDRFTTLTSADEDDIRDELVNIYPNPAFSEISIDASEDVELSIISTNGTILNKYELKKGLHLLDIGQYPSGIYYSKIILKRNSRVITKKIFIN